MTRTEALKVQKELKAFLLEKGIHHRIEHVCTPDLRFINFSEISIKVTGNNKPNTESIRLPGPCDAGLG